MGCAYQIILKVLNNDFGILFLGNENEDFSISDYIIESVEFIQFIIAIENEIGRELSDEFLNIEILNSARGLAEMIDQFIEKRTE